MKKLSLFIALMMVSFNAYAVDYTPEGKAIATGYDGPSIGFLEVGLVGVGVGIVLNIAEVPASAVLPLGAIAWGAHRTSKYRHQFVKDTIHMNLEEEALLPVKGSVWEVTE